MNLFLLVALMAASSWLVATSEAKIVWRVRPQEYQIAKEYDNVKLNCEFENSDPSDKSTNYFVIWYKDGSSQNFISLNNQLANLNANDTYEIVGKYSLIVKNVTRNNSGIYTCQLFQSNELISSVNLTVLVPPKYARVSTLKQQQQEASRESLVEGERVSLECCTNMDATPEPVFEWHRVDLKPTTGNKLKFKILRSNHTLRLHQRQQVCNYLPLNLTRMDNGYQYKCIVTNDALFNKKPVDSVTQLNVEYKPEAFIHLNGVGRASNNRIELIENTTIVLTCNASGHPNILTYEWYLDESLLREYRTSSIVLRNLNRHQSGTYTCKASNKHGSARSSFNVEILYSQVNAVNRSQNWFAESQSLRQRNALFLNTYENSSLSLTCEIESSRASENVVWHFFQVDQDGAVVNRFQLSNGGDNAASRSPNVNSNRRLSSIQKRFYSHLNLFNVTMNNSGYYSCSINSVLKDDLNQTVIVKANATYFLQVQYVPIVKPLRKIVYANFYDQVELNCEVKSNPQSIFSWHFAGNNKELFSNFKYNLSTQVYKQIDRVHLDNVKNYHLYKSTLVVNSLTQFDYGDYYCKANNIIGENTQVIRLKRKHKPEMPENFKTADVTSTGIRLNWLAGSNGGDNATFIVNINGQYNLTTYKDYLSDYDDPESFENRFNSIEIRGLDSDKTYEFKILAFNSLGHSEFSTPLRVTTPKNTLDPDRLPKVLNAHFNELHEAICFELSDSVRRIKSTDYMIKIEIGLNEDLVAAAQDLIRLNNRTGGSAASSLLASSTSGRILKQLRSNLESLEANHYKTKSYLIDLNDASCILYSQLVALDYQLRSNMSSWSKMSNRKKIFNTASVPSNAIYDFNAIVADSATTSTSSLPIMSSLYSKYGPNSKLESLVNNFFEFKKFHRVNVTLCYKNDSSICTDRMSVYDYQTDFSNYITVVAIGCSAVLIFIILLIVSLCCCCCHRSKKKDQQIVKQNLNGGKPTTGSLGVSVGKEIGSKLVKNFPVVTQDSNFDYSDSSAKSSQQHILNGTHSSSSSHSEEGSHYHNHPESIEHSPAMLINKYGITSYKIDYRQHQVTSSNKMAHTESDSSSSTSLENKTMSTSNGKSSSSHSPFTILHENQHSTTNNLGGYFSPLASNSYSNFRPNNYSSHHVVGPTTLHNSLNKPPTGLAYNSGTTSVYVKAANAFQSSSVADSQEESAYSTPVIGGANNPATSSSASSNGSSSNNKKLVYEVIV